ncbi:MAG: anti-sigma factor [Aestuariivirgaceae bacterium]
MARPDSPEDREVLAGEYVLGTLDSAERAEAERLRASDPGFASAIAAWERRLDPLSESVAPVVPPEGLFQRIERRLGEATGDAMLPSATVIKLERRLRHWRAATLAMTALAASLIGFILAAPREPVAHRFVAAVQQGDQQPVFVVAVDTAKGIIAVRPVAARAPESGRDYELWAVGGGRPRPQSLGLITIRDANLPVARLESDKAATIADTVFAVSLEPRGGSPTGQPTGPVLWTGKLVPVD